MSTQQKSLKEVLETIKKKFKERIVYERKIPSKRGRLFPFPEISPLLQKALNEQGIKGLYEHQLKCFEIAKKGENVIVSTGTASGKSLCYHLPVLQNLLENEKSTALYLYPTKALAQDQLRFLNSLSLPLICGTYDGDTYPEERKYLRERARIILSNPDMLHRGILPNHRLFGRFLMNLSFVVLDEVHTLRGVFGANVSLVIQRLLRICQFYGAKPQFIMASATIANPQETAEGLSGLPFKTVKKDSSPRGKRYFIFWNPPLQKGEEKRVSSNRETTEIFVELLKYGLRTIVFSKSKLAAELILKYTKEKLSREPEIQSRIASYRAGYLPQERRRIEKKLFSGNLLGVSATSALELGIDIGELDASLLNGYPGTISSTWQQAGRAGRRRKETLTILIAQEDPLDQYFMHHPKDFFRKPHEAVIFDAQNPFILKKHILCAVYERPLEERDKKFFSKKLFTVIKELEKEGKLIKKGKRWYLKKLSYPAEKINIRSSSDKTYSLVEEETGSLIGTLDESVFFLYAHPGAIYLHEGESYLVIKVDLETKVALLRKKEVSYYTQPREESYIEILKVKKNKKVKKANVFLGDVRVSSQVLAYQKRDIFTGKSLGVEYLHLPPRIFETESLWFTIKEEILKKLSFTPQELAGGTHAIEHAAIAILPLFALCDRWDVGGVSTPAHYETDEPTIFIYDAFEGGIGLNRRAFEKFEEHLKKTYSLIKNCPCENGCPSCIQSPKCGNWNEPLDKNASLLLLKEMGFGS
jgi:DEAD/DEAH box helicase domain-containing protein